MRWGRVPETEIPLSLNSCSVTRFDKYLIYSNTNKVKRYKIVMLTMKIMGYGSLACTSELSISEMTLSTLCSSMKDFAFS